MDLAPRRTVGPNGSSPELTRLSTLIDELNSGKIARVPGSAVFFTRAKDETLPVMSWHVRDNRSLHEHVLALTMTVVPVSAGRSGRAVDVEARG